jgi:hypothetical protein
MLAAWLLCMLSGEMGMPASNDTQQASKHALVNLTEASPPYTYLQNCMQNKIN